MNDKSTAHDIPIRILIVENREETRETLQNSLSLWGYKPIVAEGSGTRLLEDAKNKAQNYRCHLAIVDKRLLDDGDFTDYSGFDLIESITPTVPIILTGYADYATARNALKRGAFDVVRKEDGPKALQEVLKRAIAEKWRSRKLSIECSPALKSETLIKRLFPNDDMVPIDEIDEILRLLFPNAKRLRLELPSGDDSPSNLLLRMRSVVVKVYENDATRPCIVKIARAKRTHEEIERFNSVRSYFTAGRYANIRGEPVQLWDLGGVVYEFIGEDSQYPIETFADYYTHESSDVIKAVINNFMMFWLPLYQRRPPQEEAPQESIIVAYTSVWGTDWLQDLMRYQELPLGIELPTLSREFGLQNPIQWLIEKVKLTSSKTFDTSATPYTELVMCHGDLHSGNMFVDSRHDVWVIDYERTGFGPRFQDLVELVVDMLTTLITNSDRLKKLLNLLLIILSPKLLKPELLKSKAPNALHKEFEVFLHFVGLAQQLGESIDAKPFYWGMFLNSMFRLMVFLKDWDRLAQEQLDETTGADVGNASELKSVLLLRIQTCLLLGGILAHRLQNWRYEWPISDWSTVTSLETGQIDQKEAVAPLRILFLAANPQDQPNIESNKEYREIDATIQEARFRERFELFPGLAVRGLDDLQRLINRYDPTVIHFSGHGTSAGQIILEDNLGKSVPVTPEQLRRVFEPFKGTIRCVVLNACFSAIQADEIAEHIDIVVGMSTEISDKSAIRFATGFYRGLGACRNLQKAISMGRSMVDLDEHIALQLLPHGIDPNRLNLCL